jgi:hypothetical protein
MKQFWVDFVRREVRFERYVVCVDADSAEGAKEKVREHYMGQGYVLTQREENTEQHSKSLDVDEIDVIDIGEAEEA